MVTNESMKIIIKNGEMFFVRGDCITYSKNMLIILKFKNSMLTMRAYFPLPVVNEKNHANNETIKIKKS